MRQTIPFKKNLVLSNKFDNITSLTLEHDYLVDEDEIKGEFIINGTYHATEASLIDEDFYQKLPFEIALSARIIRDSINLTIDDFSYNKVSDDTISLNIDLLLNYDEEESKPERLERILEELDLDDEDRGVKEPDIIIDAKEETLEDDILKEITINPKQDKVNTEIISEFVSDKKNYVTYKVYIAREFDDFNSIAAKFNVTMKDLEEYNEIKELQVGDKVIIPHVFE